MTRRDFLKACGLVAVGTALMRPLRALAHSLQPESTALPPNSAYERMKKLRIDYMLAAGNPALRFDMNRAFIALTFEMKAAGASRKHIMRMGQKTLYDAKRETARMRGLEQERRL